MKYWGVRGAFWGGIWVLHRAIDLVRHASDASPYIASCLKSSCSLEPPMTSSSSSAIAVRPGGTRRFGRRARVSTVNRNPTICRLHPEGLVVRQPCHGRPYHQEEIQKTHIRKAESQPGSVGIRSGTATGPGWTKRERLSPVQKELVRHASMQTTMNIYGKAVTDRKRQAHSKVVEMVFKPRKTEKNLGPRSRSRLMGVSRRAHNPRNRLKDWLRGKDLTLRPLGYEFDLCFVWFHVVPSISMT
jgi:hypothetical protein